LLLLPKPHVGIVIAAMARVKLGVGVAYHTRGNYPAARMI
jgi:hypothetical protein